MPEEVPCPVRCAGRKSLLKVVDVRSVLFSQSTISEKFQDGGSVHSLTTDLKSGKANIEQLPKIRVVVMEDGSFVSLDNRRLYAMKQALKYSREQDVVVELVDRQKHAVELERKRSTCCEGAYLRVTGDVKRWTATTGEQGGAFFYDKEDRKVYFSSATKRQIAESIKKRPELTEEFAQRALISEREAEQARKDPAYLLNKLEEEMSSAFLVNKAGRPVQPGTNQFMKHEEVRKLGWTPEEFAQLSRMYEREAEQAPRRGADSSPMKAEKPSSITVQEEPSPSSLYLVNKAGRPVQPGTNQFMKHEEARKLGWSPEASSPMPTASRSSPSAKAASSPPANSATTSSSRAAAAAATTVRSASCYSGGGGSGGCSSSSYSSGGGGGIGGCSSSSFYSGGGSSGGGGGGGGGFSGSACYAVSSSPTGPCKADGTPDMRYAGNRA